jgi:hypothetical protein
MTYYVAGRTQDAETEWREVLTLDPENKFAKLYLELVAERAAGAQTPAPRPS